MDTLVPVSAFLYPCRGSVWGFVRWATTHKSAGRLTTHSTPCSRLVRGGVAGWCSGGTVKTTHSRGCVPGAWCRAARVKKLMKLDKDCKHVSKDAIALTAVATVRCSHSPRAAACVDPPQERHVAVNRRRFWRTWRVRRGGVLARDRRSSTRTLVGALRSGHLSPLAACLT